MGIAALKLKKSAATRPTRDEFELEEIGNALTEAHREKKEVVLTVWGMDEPVRGRIVKMDADTRRIHVERYGETTKVPFLDIMRVGSPEY
ncbi:YolD-like family protein [Paenibacillus naphthalenovorans]|uniref:YolD-like family protein n=1 Tax=Paenibacillus naphthalenovorans TaxID=162209 RepID=UPI00088A77D1|nr:YolD-like family protein [Paenibacillus naphthalenovorans]SDJ95560.1 YolD-like protein [Paenibacillus naphthalenovorans]